MSEQQNLSTRVAFNAFGCPGTILSLKTLGLALALSGLGALSARAQYPASGRVTTADGAIPYGIGIQAHRLDSGSSTVPVAHTDAEGRFSFSLPAGTYAFYADPSHSIYPPSKAYVRYRPEWYQDAFYLSQATSLPVGPGNAPANIGFVLERYAEVSGRVVNATTLNPIAGVSLSAFETGSDSQIGGVLQTTTDSDGFYTLYVNGGTWRIFANPAGLGYAERYYSNQVSQTAADLLTLELAEVRTNINFALPPVLYGTLSGYVYQPDGAPLADASVQASGHNYEGSATTDSRGFYRMVDLRADQYTVRAMHPAYPEQYYCSQWRYDFAHRVAVTAGSVRTNLNFQMAAPAQISGTVTNDSGQPLSGLSLAAWARNGGSAYVATAADGSYTFGMLPPGHYRVFANSRDSYENRDCQYYIETYYPPQSSVYEATLIPVDAGATVTGIDFGLTRGGVIAGVLSNALGYAQSSRQIYAYPAYADIYSGDNLEPLATYSDYFDGSYQLTGLPPARYRIQARGESYQGQAGSFYDAKLAFEQADILDLTITNLYTNICPFIYPQSKISGNVKRSGGVNLRSVSVYALSTEGYVVGYSEGTDSSGNFTIESLPPGAYVVYAVPVYYNEEYKGSYAPAYFGGSSLANATRIDLAIGETRTGINLQVSTVTGGISGRVTRAVDGVPLEGVYIYALSVGNTVVRVGSATTDANGNYTMRGIPPGNYHVQAYGSSSDSYARQYYANQTTRALANLVSVVSSTTPGIDFALQEVVPQDYVSGMLAPLCSTNDQPVVFAWKEVSGARFHELQVDDVTAGTPGIIRQQNIEGTDWVSTVTLTPGHQYRARVRGGTSAGYGEWGPFLPFTLMPPDPFTLTVNVVGPGSVTLDPPGGSYAPETVVTLSAVDGVAFDHWEGVDSGFITTTAVVTMNTNRTVTAYFLGNRAPEKPVCLAPIAGARVGLQPLLQGSPFTDPDPSSTHSASHWQVADASIGFSSPLLSEETGPTAAYPVPSGSLTYADYLWRVRYKDNLGAWSTWSDAAAFDATLAIDTVVASETGTLEVSWTGVSGYLYTVYRSESLNPANWQPIPGFIALPGTGGPLSCSLDSAAAQHGFLRIEMTPTAGP